MSKTLAIILISGTLLCALIGGVWTAVRVSRFVRRQRIRKNAMKSEGIIEVRKVKQDAGTTQAEG